MENVVGIFKNSEIDQVDELFVITVVENKIETGKIFPVCGNTFRMLQETRFKQHFEFFGSRDKHFGIFSGCGTLIPFDTVKTQDTSSGCC